MYIALYCVVIAVLCGLVVTYFVVRDVKHKKKYKELNKDKDVDVQHKSPLPSEKDEPSVSLENEVTEQKVEAEFEDFTLNGADEEIAKRGTSRPLRINPFSFDEEDDKEDDVDAKFAEYEKFLRQSLNLDDQEEKKKENAEEDDDKKFAEYEEFLRRNLDLNDEDNQKSDIDALAKFDFDSIRGKSRAEIDEILRTLPPKARELLMTDILARKNYDEEE